MWFLPVLARSWGAPTLYKQIFDKNCPKPWLLYFRTEKNQDCDRIELDFNQTRGFIGDAANFAIVDANTEFRISTKLRVSYVPAFVTVFRGKSETFEGEPSKERLFNLMANLIGKKVPILKDNDLKKRGNMVVGFTHRLKTPPYIAFAANNMSTSGIKFGYVNKNSLFEEYGIKKLPASVFIKDGQVEKVEGPDDLQTYLYKIREFFNVEVDTDGLITEEMKIDL